MEILSLSLKKSKIIIEGNIESFILNKSRIKNRLKNSFNNFYIQENKIIIEDTSFNDPQSIFNFKSLIDNFLKDKVKLNYSNKFLQKIDSFIGNQKLFSKFSLEAQKIWSNQYDKNDFEKFTNSLSKNMPNRRLYRLQLLSSYHLAFSQNSCNFSVPGSGKTSIVYGAYAFLKNIDDKSGKRVNKMLILGPQSSFEPWEEEFKECFGYETKIFNSSGTTREDKKNALKGIGGNDYEIILLTYNSASNLTKEIEIFLKMQNTMFVCDEAHKIKAYGKTWSSSVLKLAPYAKSRIILTGTPCPNGYEDLYNLFKFIYPDKSILPYRYEFLKSMSETKLLTRVEELKKHILPYFTRIKKSDLKLPPYTNHEPIFSKLDDLEKQVYNKILDSMSKREVNAFSLHHRLIQTTSNLFLLKKPLKEIEEARENFDDEILLDEVLGFDLHEKVMNLDKKNYTPSKFLDLLKILKERIPNNDKVIIWCRYVDTIKSLDEFLKKNGFIGDYIIGETSTEEIMGDTERSKILKTFKNTQESKYLISNPIVLGESVSLHKKCHHAIYLEMDYSAAPYFQSRDRIHRVWLDKNLKQRQYPTNYYNIISEGDELNTIDLEIYNKVNLKIKKMLKIIEDDIPFFNDDIENTRDEIIKKIINDYEKNRA